MGRKQPPQREFRFGSDRLDEVAAVLEVSPEATDTEVCDAINRWWTRRGHDDPPIIPADVTAIRTEMGIPQTSRKPYQKLLFDVKSG